MAGNELSAEIQPCPSALPVGHHPHAEGRQTADRVPLGETIPTECHPPLTIEDHRRVGPCVHVDISVGERQGRVQPVERGAVTAVCGLAFDAEDWARRRGLRLDTQRVWAVDAREIGKGERFRKRFRFRRWNRHRACLQQTLNPAFGVSPIETGEARMTSGFGRTPQDECARDEHDVVERLFRGASVDGAVNPVAAVAVRHHAKAKGAGRWLPIDGHEGGNRSLCRRGLEQEPAGLAQDRRQVALKGHAQDDGGWHSDTDLIPAPRWRGIGVGRRGADDGVEQAAVIGIRQARDCMPIDADRLRLSPLSGFLPLTRQDFHHQAARLGRTLEVEHVDQLASWNRVRRGRLRRC